MSAIHTVLAAATDRGDVPGIVAMAGNRGGVFYEGAFGVRGLDSKTPMTMDSVFRIFSMTKAIGTIAAVKLIESGDLELDAPVESILPTFAEIQVLDGFDGDKPILRAPKTKATVRQLATHTSGLTYEFWNPDIPKYMEATGHPSILSGTKQALMYPLTFDPGTKWDYGIGIDWLGQCVEAVSGKRIDAFCQQEIFDPLGMKDTVFECEGDQAARLVSAHGRGEDGALGVIDLAPPPKPEVYGMGHALYSTAADYTRFLRMLLNKGSLDGATVLKPETVDMLQRNHMGDLMVRELKTVVPPITNDAEFFPGVPKKYGLGFMINLEPIPGMRAAGSQSWAGVLNTHMWYDPANGICGVIMMQLLPFADHKAMAVYGDFEKAVYASL